MKKLYYFIIPLFVFAIFIALSPTNKAFAKDTDGIVKQRIAQEWPDGSSLNLAEKEKSWLEKEAVDGEKWNKLAAANIPLEDLRFVMQQDPYDVQYAVVTTLPAKTDTSTRAEINKDIAIAKLETGVKEGRYYTKPIVEGSPGVVQNSNPFFINSLNIQV